MQNFKSKNKMHTICRVKFWTFSLTRKLAWQFPRIVPAEVITHHSKVIFDISRLSQPFVMTTDQLSETMEAFPSANTFFFIWYMLSRIDSHISNYNIYKHATIRQKICKRENRFEKVQCWKSRELVKAHIRNRLFYAICLRFSFMIITIIY